MGEEVEDSNEGSGDGHEAYEGDDTEVGSPDDVLTGPILTVHAAAHTVFMSRTPR